MYQQRNETATGQWSVYAEFTITHPTTTIGDPDNVPTTRTEQSDNGVRMTYTFNSPKSHTWTPSGSAANEASRFPETDGGTYGFQKGNLLFTSTPPNRKIFNRLNAESSGYGSNLLSPNSSSSFASVNHDGRKCKSTCNITLCPSSQCGRTQSLRCQTPSSRSDGKNTFYGCGDPWCHHLRFGDDFSIGGRCSPVPETCEDCPSVPDRPQKAVRSLSRELDNRRDASVQTFEMVDKCTSPLLKINDNKPRERVVRRRVQKVRRRSLSSGKLEMVRQRSKSPSCSFTPDSLEAAQVQSSRRLTRSPRLKGNIPQAKNDISPSTTDDKSINSSKKPRTVHIDVYCTGTEVESDSSTGDASGNDTASTPQTVFESQQLKITHKRADNKDVPMTAKDDKKEKSDSDESLTSAYPSKLSSYSTIKDYTSSISSVPKSWLNSMSSCAIPDLDCDSLANTSWKDNTYSDVDSIIPSRSSITGTDSLLFVPRKLQQKKYSIDETPELVSKSEDSISLHQSDSFEYANSDDKLRIKRLEAMLKNTEKSSRHDQQPNLGIRKKVTKKESKDSDSEDSTDSGNGWTFLRNDSKKLGRDSTVRRNNNSSGKVKPHPIDQGSLSDSNRSPSSAVLIQRLSLNPALRAPFAVAPGSYTEHRNVAKKFGPVVGAFKKPGHHVGPVRNPECSCAHCRTYHENFGFRSRTRSLDANPSYDWKQLRKIE